MDPLTIKLTLDAETAQKLLSEKPRSLATATFCAVLIERALDRGVTLGADHREAPSTILNTIVESNLIEDTTTKEESTVLEGFTSIEDTSKNIKYAQNADEKPKKPRKPKAKGSPEFEEFWKIYQSCPRKAVAQSKPRAIDAWANALKLEPPERLLEAARRAVEQTMACEWDYRLPDAFRWLRDGRFNVLLEDHAAAKPSEVW